MTADDDNKENLMEQDVNIPDITEVPTKCVVNTENVAISASIQYIDFEGRSDIDSMKKIIAKVRPRRLVIVRGVSDEITNNLKNYLASAGSVAEDKIFIPTLNEIIDATTESHIYQVYLLFMLHPLSVQHFSLYDTRCLFFISGEIARFCRQLSGFHHGQGRGVGLDRWHDRDASST